MDMLVIQEPAGGHGCHKGHMVLVDMSDMFVSCVLKYILGFD